MRISEAWGVKVDKETDPCRVYSAVLAFEIDPSVSDLGE